MLAMILGCVSKIKQVRGADGQYKPDPTGAVKATVSYMKLRRDPELGYVGYQVESCEVKNVEEVSRVQQYLAKAFPIYDLDTDVRAYNDGKVNRSAFLEFRGVLGREFSLSGSVIAPAERPASARPAAAPQNV